MPQLFQASPFPLSGAGAAAQALSDAGDLDQAGKGIGDVMAAYKGKRTLSDIMGGNVPPALSAYKDVTMDDVNRMAPLIAANTAATKAQSNQKTWYADPDELNKFNSGGTDLPNFSPQSPAKSGDTPVPDWAYKGILQRAVRNTASKLSGLTDAEQVALGKLADSGTIDPNKMIPALRTVQGARALLAASSGGANFIQQGAQAQATTSQARAAGATAGRKDTEKIKNWAQADDALEQIERIAPDLKSADLNSIITGIGSRFNDNDSATIRTALGQASDALAAASGGKSTGADVLKQLGTGFDSGSITAVRTSLRSSMGKFLSTPAATGLPANTPGKSAATNGAAAAPPSNAQKVLASVQGQAIVAQYRAKKISKDDMNAKLNALMNDGGQ